MAALFRRRTVLRLAGFLAAASVIRFIFAPSSSEPHEILEQNVLDLVSLSGEALNVQRHGFLQVRMGRDERSDLLSDRVHEGMMDYWNRFQKPYILSSETSQSDAQSTLLSIDQLLSLNGWVAGLCPTLTRPFGQNKQSDAYDALIAEDHLFYIAIAIHSADHFLLDQLAVIVQLAKRLGTHNLFVSMLDYASTDSTETLTDLCEAVLIMLGVPYRIRRVDSVIEDPAASYYPAEEAHMRNLALEPLRELYMKRHLKFHRVIWLKGFTCPNDILETIKISLANDAAMVCGMDWSEHNGFYIFSDRWRTRDILGDQFRQAKSSSKPDAGPPRDPVGAERYTQHLPFQVFCCESGTHVVDPAQSYYAGLVYRHGTDFANTTELGAEAAAAMAAERESDSPCLDSAQAWFCRDLWVHKASEGARLKAEADSAAATKKPKPREKARRRLAKRGKNKDEARKKAGQDDDDDADVGADYDAMDDDDYEEETEGGEGGEDADEWEGSAEEQGFAPNSAFEPARILVNPRCVTTYAGVSHTQLAMDLFGPELMEGAGEAPGSGKYTLNEWAHAPESFVCQEQRTTGGRKAMKTQRRMEFLVQEEIERSV